MAKYFNTVYTKESNFLQLEKKTNNKSFLRYFNFLIIFISLMSLVLEYEQATNRINNEEININSNLDLNIENNKIILIEIINSISEEEIDDFIYEVKKELTNLKEYNGTVSVIRSKLGIVKELKINNIKDYNNLKIIFEKIQYDNNIIVTIE